MDAISKESCSTEGHLGTGGYVCLPTASISSRICILAIVFLGFGQAVGMPIEVGEPADPFATPLEILPEWFLLPAFEILRAVPNKLLGIGAMIAIPVGLATVPILEAANPFANPIRRPVGTWLFIAGLVVSLALGYLSALPL